MTQVSSQAIRTTLSRHIQDNFSMALPVEWENMPPQHQQPEQGWIHIAIVFERFEKLGFGLGVRLGRGRIRLTIAVGRGVGMVLMDQVMAELTGLLANQSIGEVRLAAARITNPILTQGYHQAVMEIGFVAVSQTVNLAQ